MLTDTTSGVVPTAVVHPQSAAVATGDTAPLHERHTHAMVTILFALLSAVFLPPVPEALWAWPTQGPQLIVRDFQAPHTPWGPGHRGLDLAAEGTSLFAPTDGVVSFAGPVATRGVLTIRTPEGLLISLEPVEALVVEGEWVTKGQLVAVLQEGHCATLCLHLGLREKGEYLSARRELGVLQRAVLLPLGSYARG